LDNQAAMQRRCHKIGLLDAFMGKDASNDIATVSYVYALVFNFTNVRAMFQRSDFLIACSSEVNI
jgi:hypothetical protein